jgi:putative ABC transport system permease protein
VSALLRMVPFVWRQLSRRPARLLFTALGVAVASFLVVGVESVTRGVRDATERDALDTRLIVYRANRFCPATSQIPQHYESRIAAIPGVERVVPMKIVVNNCRASLDVVTFRGVPDDRLEAATARSFRIVAGSLDEWRRRGDAAAIGAALAARRNVKVGDRFTAAGVSVYVAAIAESDEPQDRNVAYVHLPFLQETAARGGTGGVVTQFAVDVRDPAALDAVAAAIDAEFARDPSPTATRAERAFAARAAADLVQVAGFARWLAVGALVGVFALVANAVALALAERSREIAILQTLGFGPRLVTMLVVGEGALLGLVGGTVGAGVGWLVLSYGSFALATEGVSVEFDASATVALVGVGWAVAIGALASALPALRAGLRPIVHSLRSA